MSAPANTQTAAFAASPRQPRPASTTAQNQHSNIIIFFFFTISSSSNSTIVGSTRIRSLTCMHNSQHAPFCTAHRELPVRTLRQPSAPVSPPIFMPYPPSVHRQQQQHQHHRRQHSHSQPRVHAPFACTHNVSYRLRSSRTTCTHAPPTLRFRLAACHHAVSTLRLRLAAPLDAPHSSPHPMLCRFPTTRRSTRSFRHRFLTPLSDIPSLYSLLSTALSIAHSRRPGAPDAPSAHRRSTADVTRVRVAGGRWAPSARSSRLGEKSGSSPWEWCSAGSYHTLPDLSVSSAQ